MVKYVLKYFPTRGRAEVIRLIFAYTGIEYEDVRISVEEWLKQKEAAPMGQMPLLEEDGVVYCQSLAINRYLARKHGLAGKDAQEAYLVDMFVDCFEDLGRKIPFHEKDEQKKIELMKEFFAVTVPETFKKIESLLKRYKCGEEYFVSKVSIADFTLMNFVDFIIRHKPDIFSETPKLGKIYHNVQAIPQIAEWIAKRPYSDH